MLIVIKKQGNTDSEYLTTSFIQCPQCMTAAIPHLGPVVRYGGDASILQQGAFILEAAQLYMHLAHIHGHHVLFLLSL